MQVILVALTYLSCVIVASSLGISNSNHANYANHANHTNPTISCRQISTNDSVLNNETLLSYLANVNVTTPEAGCTPARFLTPIRDRRDIGTVLKLLDLKGVGVEVGVQKGLFTEIVLEQWTTAHAYVQVDLWQQQDNYKDSANVNNSQQLLNQQEACMRGQRAKALLQCQNYSSLCATFFPDESLDFVYIDARHDRKGVLEDLKAYWPKLRMGGVMAGHDYTVQDEPNSLSDPAGTGQNWTRNYDGTVDESKRVTKGAVDDFFSGTEETPEDLKNCPRQLVISYHEAAWNTWMVSK